MNWIVMGCKHTDRRKVSLGFTNESVQEGQHICYLYNDDAERLQVMGKFVDSGIKANDKILYLVDSVTPEEMLDSLMRIGVDARSQPSRVTMSEAASTYCPSGQFIVNEMIDLVEGFYDEAVQNGGFEGARGTGEMSWSLVEGRTDKNSLMEYEASLNSLIIEHPMTVCCQYDTRLLDGDFIMDLLAVHPVMLVLGQLVHNPYYVEPSDFIEHSSTCT